MGISKINLKNARFNINTFKTSPLFMYGEDVKVLCKPLFFNTDVNFFSFIRVFNDGCVSCLSSDIELVHDSIFTEVYTKARYLKPHGKLTDGKYLWRFNQLDNDEQQHLDIIHAHDYAHGLSIVKTDKKFTDCYHFAGRKGNELLDTFYFNHLDLLERFIQFFHTEGDKLVTLSDRKRFKMFPSSSQTKLQKIEKLQYLELEQLLHRAISKKNINQLRNALPLPFRQQDCAALLLSGMSYGQIAQQLNISKRTVEEHANKLKERLGCQSKSELIATLMRQYGDKLDAIRQVLMA